MSRFFSFGSMISLGVHSILIGVLWVPFQRVPLERPFLVQVVWNISSASSQPIENNYVSLSSPPLLERKAPLKRRKIFLHKANYKLTKTRDSFFQRDERKRFGKEKEPLRTKKARDDTSQSFLASPQNFARQDYHPLPPYPWICRKNGEEGEVGVVVKVNEEGHVIQAKLFKSSGYERLDTIALDSVKSWVYARAGVQEYVLFVFRLESEPQIHYIPKKL